MYLIKKLYFLNQTNIPKHNVDTLNLKLIFEYRQIKKKYSIFPLCPHFVNT